MKITRLISSLLLFNMLFVSPAFSQSASTGAVARANSIVANVEIDNAAKRSATLSLLVAHYDTLAKIFSERKAAVQTAEATADKELALARARSAWDAANGKLNKLHAVFLGKLSKELSAGQIEKLKDEMTEGGLAREYNNYLAMMPGLTDQQKAQLMLYLAEARENAMDAETPENRKEWFIKYRGRANNFLAAAGYDLRKATEELKAQKAAKLKE